MTTDNRAKLERLVTLRDAAMTTGISSTEMIERIAARNKLAGAALNAIALAERQAAENEELRKDALRYRWLRDGNDVKESEATRIATNMFGLEWDKAIDKLSEKQR